ncbi:MAG: amidase [Acidimicrobiales bacterium]
MAEIDFWTATELGAAFKRQELSPVEATEAALGRIAELDPVLHCYAVVFEEAARRDAARAEAELAAGRRRGPLHGVPVAVKDLCDVEGVPTMAGAAVLRDNVASSDATVVRRLRDAGAVILGKLNLTEGALAGYNPDFDVPMNPWGQDRWAGVSSSGSGAATAAGLCVASLGSDTGGSIRFPAAANGVVGLKPTHGRVSRSGVFPLAPSLDHVGPLTRCSMDAGLVLEAIAGEDAADPTSIAGPAGTFIAGINAGISGLRVGVDNEYNTTEVDPTTVDAISTAVGVLNALGAEIVEIEVPSLDETAWFVICGSEAAVAHDGYYPDRAGEYGGFAREFLAQGNEFNATDLVRAQQQRATFTGELNRVFDDVDVIACPSFHGSAFLAPPDKLRGSQDEVLSLSPHLRPEFTARFDLSGNPTISLPAGFDEDHMPLSLQLVGRHMEEATLLRIGQSFEVATEWHTHHPPLP